MLYLPHLFIHVSSKVQRQASLRSNGGTTGIVKDDKLRWFLAEWGCLDVYFSSREVDNLLWKERVG